MWTIFLTTLHVVACIFLVIVVLLQKGKGSDVSAVFGGSSQTIFGSSGAGNFLTKLTSATAIVFMLTSLSLTIGTTKQETKSVFDDVPAETTPVTPEQAPAPPAAESGAPAATVTTPEKPGEAAPANSTATASAPAETPPPAAQSAPAAPAAPSTAAPSAGTAPATTEKK
jgi:preprotein translocase subunit SecG